MRRLRTILNSGTVLEQFSSSFSPSAVHCLICLNPSSGRSSCKSTCMLGCVIFSEQWWLFRKATLASSTELKALVYSSDICNGSSFQSWEFEHGFPYFHAYGIEKILWI